MSFIQEEIEEVAAKIQADVVPIPALEAEQIRNQLLAKFTNGRASTFMWEDFQNAESVQVTEGWRWVAEYADHESAIMFFNFYQDPAILCFTDATEIPAVIAECTRFEFYVTNFAADYLIAFNHHDFVIAVGTAADWLEQHAT